MIDGKTIAVVLPAYNAASTLKATVDELPDIVDHRILVDDGSRDGTPALARELGTHHVRPRRELRLRPQPDDLLPRSTARRRGHRRHGASGLPVHAAARDGDGEHDRLRRVRRGARLTHSRRHRASRRHAALQVRFEPDARRPRRTCVLGAKLSEYHTGYRAFSRTVLETLPLLENSDDFVFDNQMLTQCLYFGFRVGEVSCPTKYFRRPRRSASRAA